MLLKKMHRPYKHCKRCARRTYGATHDYHCHAFSVDVTVTVVDGKVKTKETDPANRKSECMNFSRKIRPMAGTTFDFIEFDGASIHV